MNPDPNNTEIELAVAETMEEIEPNRVWEFGIRDNVLWHDGEPVTVDDVIYGIWLSLNKDSGATNETPVVGILGGDKLREQGGTEVAVDGATKIGDRGLRIELEKPIPNYWVNWGVGYWPMPKHIFGDKPFEELFAEPYATMPIGNGPFKAAKFVDGQYMEMDANPDFYLGKPLLDKFIVRFGDADTLTAALEAQEIDGAGVSAGPVYDRLTSLDYIVGNPVPRDHPDGFVVNWERFPDHAAALNKAISYAIDVPTLNEQLFNGTLRPSNYLFGHVVGLETPPAGFPTYEYDPEKAQAILQEAGWDANTELEWMMWSPPTPAQDAMQAMLAAAGIKTKYRQIDAATVIDELYRNGNYDLSYGNFGPAQSMEDNWKYIKCGWGYDEGGFNYARYCNEEVDALWQQALDEPDPAAGRPIWDEVSLALAEAPPQATLSRGSVIYAWNKRVRGAYPYQYRLPVRPAFEKVWIAQES
jgi:peptide/nickel transport system substrate-binding protein